MNNEAFIATSTIKKFLPMETETDFTQAMTIYTQGPAQYGINEHIPNTNLIFVAVTEPIDRANPPLVSYLIDTSTMEISNNRITDHTMYKATIMVE